MKTAIKLFMIIVFIAVITFTMAAQSSNNPLANTTWAEGDVEHGGYSFSFTGTEATSRSWTEAWAETWKGTYTVSGNKLTITYDDGDIIEGTFTIKGNTLVLDFGHGESIYTKMQ